MVWTQFWDMHSGGGQKLAWSQVFIEAPRDETRISFSNRFGRDPEHTTCQCCGEDYSISEYDDLAQATGFHRNCAYGDQEKKYLEVPKQSHGRWMPNYQTLEQYLASGEALAIYADQIAPQERIGDIAEMDRALSWDWAYEED